MAYLLNIDTATEHASICISNDAATIGIKESPDQRNHASFLQPAIQELCKDTGIALAEIAAIAVTSGPGSYTGLRVGMASAKGICYALQKPLITINTLAVMALATRQETHDLPADSHFCPMIDARRMEVFTALYNNELQIVADPGPMVLDENSFSTQMALNTLIFSGSGAFKMEAFIAGKNAIISTVQHNATHLAILAAEAFHNEDFANLAYAEPAYLKAFHNTQKSP